MAQQINLYTPILLAPRLHFSARAMAQSLTLLTVVLAAFCGWVLWQQQGRSREAEQQRLWRASEQQQLDQALAVARARNDPAQLERELARLQQDNLVLQTQLAATEGTHLRAGQTHSDMLALMARTVPPAAWITRLQVAPTRLEIDGVTLEPAALQAWTRQLAREPLLAGQPVAQVRVEQIGHAPQGLQTLSGEPALRTEPLPGGSPAWAFRLSATRTAGLSHAQAPAAGAAP